MTIETSELEALLADFRAAVHHDHDSHRRRHRHWALAGAALVTVVLASVAVAGTYGDWWTNAAPPVHEKAVAEAAKESAVGPLQPDLTRQATVARTADDELVAVATKTGGFCLSAFHNGVGLGTSCSSEPVQADGTASTFETHASYPLARDGKPLPADQQYWVADGRITDANAVTLDLSSVGLPANVPLSRGGFFIFDIPQEKWASLDGAHGSIAIRDAGGATIRIGCINAGVAPGKGWSGGGFIDGAGATCAEQPPVPPRPDMPDAKKIVEHTLVHDEGGWTAGTTIALWQATTDDGRVCSFWALASPRPQLALDENGLPITTPNGPPANAVNPTECRQPGRWSFPGLINAGRGDTLVHGHYAVTIEGSVKPGSEITNLAVVAADGAKLPVTFGANAFFAELPDAPVAGRDAGPVPGGPYTIVGYDANGNEIATAPIR